MLIAGQRVANEDRVAPLGVERAVGLISDLHRAEIDPGIEPQWIVRRKSHDQRVRMIRLARTVGAIERDAGLGHKCFPDCYFNYFCIVAPAVTAVKGG